LGVEGPTIAAAGLHPWVWEAASRPWADGHRRSAIQAAGARIDLETQAKLQRWDVSGTELGRQAWSADPPEPGRPRLRPTGRPDSEAYKSKLGGARALHQGVMLGIRNWATHDLDEPEEQVALEYLAALGVLARWIDDAELVEAPDSAA
jgi:hypothetical protein